MMQLLRLALATATVWGVYGIPFINAVKIGDKVSTILVSIFGHTYDDVNIMIDGSEKIIQHKIHCSVCAEYLVCLFSEIHMM